MDLHPGPLNGIAISWRQQVDTMSVLNQTRSVIAAHGSRADYSDYGIVQTHRDSPLIASISPSMLKVCASAAGTNPASLSVAVVIGPMLASFVRDNRLR